MSELNRTDEIERLLVMAAAVLGLGPETDLTRANTARVVNQALLWFGLAPEAIDQGWQEAEEQEAEGHSLNEQV